MQSLNRFIQAGKVLYIGVSDTPAWIVSKANQCEFLKVLYLVASMAG